MKNITIKHIGIEENVIVRENERLAGCMLTMPIQLPHTAHNEILMHVYTEALHAGAGALSREKFLDEENKLGSHIEVGSDSRNISISCRTLDTSLPATLKLLELLITKPTFTNSELKRIKEFLSNSLILSKEDAKSRAYEGFVNTLTDTKDTRYVFSADELTTELKSISQSDLKKLHQMIFKREWILTSGGSEISTKKIFQTIKKVRGKSNGAEIPVFEPIQFKERSNRSMQLIDIPHKQNIEFSIGNTLSLNRTDVEYPAFVFGMSVLALYGGFSGRLMSTVREKEGLTYSIYGQAEKVTKTEQGFWRIATFFSPKDCLKGIESTLREINIIREKGITENELKRFKSILNTRNVLVNDSITKKMMRVHALREIHISNEEFEEFNRKIQSMSLIEVQNALKKYLSTKNLVISCAGPVQSVKKEIEKFAK